MVVDPEEECDCGLPNYCRNKCCDPHTCQFSLRNPKVQCADGACCDLMVYLKNHSLGRHNIIIKFFFFSGGRLVNWNCRESNAVQRKMNAICRNTVSETVPFARLISINTTASSVNPAKYYKFIRLRLFLFFVIKFDIYCVGVCRQEMRCRSIGKE